MTDPHAPEPLLEIMMLGPEPGTPSTSPSAPAASVSGSPLSSVKVAVRTEQWLVVVHLLILIAFAGLVVYFLSLVWRENDRRPGPEISGTVLPAGASAEVPFEALAAALPVRQAKACEKKEMIEPAVAPVPGAEEPIPVSSRPEPAPPPPAPIVTLQLAAIPEPDPVTPAAGEPEEAEVPVEIRTNPELIAFRRLLEEAVSLRATNPVQSADRYRKAVALQPDRSELWKDIGDLELSTGMGEEAARAYREYLRFHPGQVDALQNLAVLHLRAGRLEEARTGFEAAIKAGPSADLYYDLGNVHLKAGDPDRAIAAYRRALEYDPRHPSAPFNLALVLEQSGKRAEAVAILAQTGSVAPGAIRLRARMEAMLGGLEADRAMDLARSSSDEELVTEVASGFRRAGEMEKALALLDRAVELMPRSAGIRLNRGAVRQGMGRAAEAAADFEEALKLEPGLADAQFNLGLQAEERGQYVSALERYSAALRSDPRLACAQNNIGTLYLKVGQAAKAVECFRRCRELAPSFSAARLNLAWGYLAMDSRGHAVEELKLYLREVPKEKQDPEAARVLRELESPRPGSPGPAH